MNKLKAKLMGDTQPDEADQLLEGKYTMMLPSSKDALQAVVDFNLAKEQLEVELTEFETDLTDFQIDNGEDLAVVAEVTAICKGHTKKLTVLQKTMLEPIAKEEERVRGMFRGVVGRLKRLEESLKAKVGAYDMRQRAERSRALSEAQTSALAGDQQTTERALALASASRMEKVDGLKIRYTIDIEIENEDLVPDEWWVIDEARIGKYARATNGEVEIPGVIYHKRPIISSTSK